MHQQSFADLYRHHVVDGHHPRVPTIVYTQSVARLEAQHSHGHTGIGTNQAFDDVLRKPLTAVTPGHI
jgi:hypothetical protein